MKSLHEIGHIVDNSGQICGMVLGEGIKSPKGVKAKIVNNIEFANLVGANKVQYFELENGVPIVRYTPEELRAVRRSKCELYGDEYFANDIRFSSAAFSCNHQTIAVSAGALLESFGTLLMMTVFARVAPFKEEDMNILKKFMQKSAPSSVNRVAENVYMVTGDPFSLLSFLSSCKHGYDINFDLMLNLNNINYKRRILGVRPASPDQIQSFVQTSILTGMNRHEPE